MEEKRIINVSNRLPVKLTISEDKLTFQQSEGGLATGLSSVFSTCKNIWIGWPGAVVNEAQQAVVTNDLAMNCLYPVYLSQQEINNFYEGFSNETLWPLFHYFPSYSKYCQHYWEAYVAVNKKFADAIVARATPDDVVWIHDYQLMLVPAMVRAALPNTTIGYFQHIPFPDYEIFRALPWKKEILNGLFGADTIGFQTEADEQHFINTVTRVLGIEADAKEFCIDERNISVQAFPISIDFKRFHDLACHETTKCEAHKIKNQINTKIVLSIDRLDYSKGILQRLRAYELFLETHPEWHQKVSLVHLVVPSRDTVCNYKELKEEMNKLISNINGKYATFGWQPIHHFYRSFSPHLLSALYKTADLALVTPLRDGMNLVCKEYIASNVSLSGVLLLSDAAGAANELKEALIINPNDITDFAGKIYEGLTMSEAEKKERMTKMRQTIEHADIFLWAKRFMKKLKETVSKKSFNVCTPVDNIAESHIIKSYSQATKRLLLLDYDGTLVPFYNKPEDAAPDNELLNLIKELASDKKNNVVIISGRDKVTLDNWLGHLPIELVGEHGAWYKELGKKWHDVPGLDTSWKDIVKDTFIVYSSDTPGTFIEEKAYSTAWHYRASDYKGETNVYRIIKDLEKKLLHHDLDIIKGNKVIEVKSSQINKGKAALQLLSKQPYDYIIAIGDDRTDEDMFAALPKNSITIKVGSNISTAAYCQRSFAEVREFIKKLTDASKKSLKIQKFLLVVK